jgi:hypothetical protein
MRQQQQELSMQRANSLALEKPKPRSREKQMDSQAKLQTPLWPELLGWLQQVEPMAPVPVTRLAMRPQQQQEMSMQRANSPTLQEARPQAREKNPKVQVKLRTALGPVNLPARAKRRG